MDIESAYQETLSFLYGFVDYSLTRSFRYAPDKFDLGRMRLFLQALGDPQQRYPIIHVAGTKGKGSVSAMCASALQAAGYQVGLYTSPHLQDYAERIQLNGCPIAHAELVALVDEFKPKLSDFPGLTTFEITTALAFEYFARQGAEAAVFEVGLGGRLDATNVVTPAVSVITSLSYDHMQYLGNTLREIAGEKAGIIKPGVPVVASPQQDEARQVIEAVALERSAPLTLVGRDICCAQGQSSLDSGQTVFIWGAQEQAQMEAYLQAGESAGAWRPTTLQIPLLGVHQVENAATAYAALQVFQTQTGRSVSEKLQAGFSAVHWPARFEVLQRNPAIVIDAAHNRDSAIRLRQTLQDYFYDRPVILVFGASEDKDISGMFHELLSCVQQVIVTRSFHPRAIELDPLVALVKTIRPAGADPIAVPAMEEALSQALKMADEHTVILVTGSVFVAAAARECWFQSQEQSTHHL